MKIGWDHFVAAARAPAPRCAVAREGMLWEDEEALVIEADRFEQQSGFYPVYRWERLHSWSFLALLVRKGVFRPSAAALAASRRSDFLYYPGNDTVDRDIVRVGDGVERSLEQPIVDAETYAKRLADALRADIAAWESAHPGQQNVVLVGGKDSQNLLLLPWRNPVLALSAQPNFALVRRFVEENGLGVEVRELEDPRDEEVLDREVLENACRANLEHYRWGAALRRIADESDGRLVFWKGQVADLLTTPYWKTFVHPPGGPIAFAKKVYARTDHLLPRGAQRLVAERYLLPRLFDALWRRCAMWQGAHMGVLRGVTGAMVRSAYHGPAVSNAWRSVSFFDAVQHDVRPRVGELLHGAPVRYPSANPGPPPSSFRAGLCRAEAFTERLARLGIAVESA